MFDNYGSVVRFWVATKLVVLIKDPKDIESVLNNRNTLIKDDLYKILLPPFGEGLVTNTDGNDINKRI